MFMKNNEPAVSQQFTDTIIDFFFTPRLRT